MLRGTEKRLQSDGLARGNTWVRCIQPQHNFTCNLRSTFRSAQCTHPSRTNTHRWWQLEILSDLCHGLRDILHRVPRDGQIPEHLFNFFSNVFGESVVFHTLEEVTDLLP